CLIDFSFDTHSLQNSSFLKFARAWAGAAYCKLDLQPNLFNAATLVGCENRISANPRFVFGAVAGLVERKSLSVSKCVELGSIELGQEFRLLSAPIPIDCGHVGIGKVENRFATPSAGGGVPKRVRLAFSPLQKWHEGRARLLHFGAIFLDFL